MVKRRHKPISYSETVTLADRQCLGKVGSPQRLPFSRWGYDWTDRGVLVLRHGIHKLIRRCKGFEIIRNKAEVGARREAIELN